MSTAFMRERRGWFAQSAVLVALIFAMLATSISPVLAAGGQFGNLSGTVVDQTSKAGIANAKVTVVSPSGTYHATTDSKGNFQLLGVPVDTYLVTVESPGYQAATLAGISILGDQTQGLGNVSLAKNLQTIGHVAARAQSGAFQPTQTGDTYTVDTARILESTGKLATTNENNILLAVPGVTMTNAGMPTIRGGAKTEVTYQYDGVSFNEPFLSNNGSNGLVSGLGSVQVVEGAGDATQSGVGSGVINVIPKRGTYPGFGFLDFEAGGPNFSHQFAFEEGLATSNGAISDYIAYTGDRFNPYYGYSQQNQGVFGNYFGTQYTSNNQFTNNFIFKFGKNQNQSVQVLYTNINSTEIGNLGGIPSGGSPYDFNTNQAGLAYYPFDGLTQGEYAGPNATTAGGLTGYTSSQYANLVGLDPGVPGVNSNIPSPQVVQNLQTEFLKFEYDNNLNSSTFLALRYYNWSQYDTNDNSFTLGPGNGGVAVWQTVGGPTTGMSFDITHQFSSNLLVTVNGKYDNAHPVWDGYEPQVGFFGLNVFDSAPNPTPADWLPGGYVYNYFTSKGEAVPRIPIWGINYQKSFFQNYGTGIRFQYTPTSAMHIDAGVRYEGQNGHWNNQLDQYGLGIPAGTPGGPYSVLPSAWTSAFLNPTEWEPRIGISYQLNTTNSVRASYGRSAVFINAQTGGTPFTLYNLGAYTKIPAEPGAQCFGAISGAAVPCTSYAQQLYWQGDAVEAPDAGNSQPAAYNNYDLSFNHAFNNGWGSRVTGFYKTGTNLPAFGLIELLPGGSAIFGTSNQGFNRTTGVEFDLTTPTKAVGFSGFFAATYQNVLGTTPPLSENETNVPLLPSASIELGNIYRAGYVSPFSMRLGTTYKTASGFSATPVLQMNIGYPYSAGNLIAANCNGKNVNIIQTNFGCGSPDINNGIFNTSGTNNATGYYDPADPGTNFNPNLAATRGVSQTAATGGYLSALNLQAGLTLQYTVKASTVGIQFINLFGNGFVNSVPALNPYYQPVTTGVSGSQTSYNPNCISQANGGFGSARGCNNIPKESYAFTNGAYVLSNGNFTSGSSIAPLQPFAFTVYYQLKL
jgi:Carboxypeptidase regulatory-like domain/TonB dependent receptor